MNGVRSPSIGFFSGVLVVGGDKKGGIQYFVVVQWGELLKIGQFCLNQNNKKKTFPDPHYTEHNSLTVAMS